MYKYTSYCTVCRQGAKVMNVSTLVMFCAYASHDYLPDDKLRKDRNKNNIPEDIISLTLLTMNDQSKTNRGENKNEAIEIEGTFIISKSLQYIQARKKFNIPTPSQLV